MGGWDSGPNSFGDVVRVETCFSGTGCISARLGGVTRSEACFTDTTATGAVTRFGGADATCTGACFSGAGLACTTTCLTGVARAAAFRFGNVTDADTCLGGAACATTRLGGATRSATGFGDAGMAGAAGCFCRCFTSSPNVA